LKQLHKIRYCKRYAIVILLCFGFLQLFDIALKVDSYKYFFPTFILLTLVRKSLNEQIRMISSSFCANFLLPKKLQTQALSTQKLLKTLTYEKATGKMLLIFIPGGSTSAAMISARSASAGGSHRHHVPECSLRPHDRRVLAAAIMTHTEG